MSAQLTKKDIAIASAMLAVASRGVTLDLDQVVALKQLDDVAPEDAIFRLAQTYMAESAVIQRAFLAEAKSFFRLLEQTTPETAHRLWGPTLATYEAA